MLSKFWIIVLTAITVVIILIAIPSYYQKDRKFSRMLQEAVDYGNFLMTVEMQMESFLINDPFAELVDKEVIPAFDKMQSVKNQIRIYETMERIPGGPQNFIKTTSKTIEDIQSQILSCESKYRLICMRKKKEVNSLRLDVKKVRETIFEILDDEELELLEREGVVLDTDTHKMPKKPGRRFDEVIEVLSSLVVLYSRMEVRESELQELMEVYNVTDEFDAYRYPDVIHLIDVVSQIDEEIKDKIDEEKNNISLFIPYIENSFRNMIEKFEKINNFQSEKKERYEKLVEMLDEDVPKIRERLKNLEYGRNVKNNEL